MMMRILRNDPPEEVPRIKTARQEISALCEEIERISEQIYEIWPRVQEYFYWRREKDPDLYRRVLRAETMRSGVRNPGAPPPTTHEQILKRMRELLAMSRMNLAFVQRLEAEMEEENSPGGNGGAA